MVEKKTISLIAKESKTRGSRTVRIPKSIFEVLQIKKGEKVVISSGKKARIVQAYGSELVEDGVIYLRKPDIKALEVQEGDSIRVDRLITLSKVVQKKTKPARKRIVKSAKSIRGRLKREEKKKKRKK